MAAREAIERAATLARDRAGLRVTDHVRDVATALLARRRAELGISEDEYLRRLEESSPSSGELEQLIREITIGETCFFRGPTLDVVRREVLPGIIERRAREPLPQLRLLSAGCATGEEAYSLAIAVRENVPDCDAWTVSITGVDINSAFLRRAADATYSEWSLRDVRPVDRERWFERVDGRWKPRRSIRHMVRFRYLNLAVDPLPAPPIGLVGLDLVLCQNVLLYFEDEIRAHVARELVQCLAPRGVLIFGPADRIPTELPPCRVRVIGDVLAYEKPGAEPVRLTWRPAGPATRASERPVAEPTWEPSFPFPKPAAVPRDIAPADASPPSPTMSEAMQLADSGDLEGAALALEALLAIDPEDARAHLAHGLLLVELGALEGAIAAFRRALYVDSSLILAHVGMALVGQRLGMAELARRHGRRVRALAESRATEAPVEGWEGMTAGRLLKLFDEQLRVLGDDTGSEGA